MKQLFLWGAMGWIVFSVAGCARITSQVVEKPRVDQEVSGNQGYLAGSGPAATPSRKSTRTILQMDIELPTAQELNPWRIRKQVAAPPAPSAAAPTPMMPEEEEIQPYLEEEESAPEAKPIAPSASSRTYKVQAGDNLEKIASKMYGDSRKWRVIYEANRDRLPSPNRIYTGQELVIPETEGTQETTPRPSGGDLK